LAFVQGCETTAPSLAVKHTDLQNDRSLSTTPDMPKKFLQKIVPSPVRIRKIKALGVLGDWVYASNLWHLNRYSASMAFFVGLFVAFMPIPGQVVVAAVLAVLLRCNLPLAVSLVFVTNPLTMAPVFYLAYEIGALIVDVPVQHMQLELSVDWLTNSLTAIWKPFLLGCLICGLFFGSVSYFVISQLWRWNIVIRWRARKRAREIRKLNDPD
tara:strand:- start:21510 stop:22145 length:636 start_codon:yes stop_codon:yes gene_type:complete